jgi:hypothetical protein
MAASEEAFVDAQIPLELHDRMGIIWGNGAPSMDDFTASVIKTEKAQSVKNVDRTIIFRILRHLPGC